MYVDRPFQRSLTSQTVYEHASVERCRSQSVNRRSSEGAEPQESRRSTSRMIMVQPRSLPRSSTDSAIEDVLGKRKEELSVEEEEDEEILEQKQEPIVSLERASILPFLFIGQFESLRDSAFICSKKIYFVVNLTPTPLGPWLRCLCDPRINSGHFLQEIHLPVTDSTHLIDFVRFFQDFNSTITTVRGTDKKVLVYSHSTQLSLMFATQFMMSYYKNVELKRAIHQIEKNLQGSLEFIPEYQRVLEHVERLSIASLTRERQSRGSIQEESSSGSSIRSTSSSHSTPTKKRSFRNGSLPRLPKLAWQ